MKFRENAIKNRYADSEIPSALHVISPGAWMGMVLFSLVLVGILIGGFASQIVIDVNARGIILSEQELQGTEMLLKEHTKHQQIKLILLKSLLKKKKILFKQHYLTMMDIEKAEAEYVAAQDEQANPSKSSYINAGKYLFGADQSMQEGAGTALVFVNYQDGKKIFIGMRAYVLPDTVSLYQHGYIKGKVSAISLYPVSKEAVYSYLGNRNLVDAFFADGAPFMVKIQLEKNNKKTRESDLFAMQSGTTVTAKIITKMCSPLQLIILGCA